MQLFKETKGGLVLLTGLMLLIFFVRFPNLMTAPGRWLIEDTYDGFRSFAAACFHVRHDSTYRHFEGMNYPYGDFVAFSDNLPLLTNSAKFLSNNFPDISVSMAAVLNLSMLVSIWLCAVFLYLIFRRLKLPTWYSVVAAIGVAMLSPQIERMGAHYGLAHPFVIPMVIYLSWIFHEKRSVWISLLIAFALFLISHIHFYLFAAGAVFIVAMTGFRLKGRELIFNAAHLVIQVVLPYLALRFFMDDPIADRSPRPYGFLAYRSYWEFVFLPMDFQIGHWINQYIAEFRPMSAEGRAYIGIVASLFFVKLFFQNVWSVVFRKPHRNVFPVENSHFFKSTCWAAFALLLFSFGIPFIIPGLEDMPYKLGQLGQLRSIGRFAWVFFYVINIIAFYALFYQFGKIKKMPLKIAMFALVLGAVNFEGFTFFFTQNKLGLIPHPELRDEFKRADNPWLDSIDVSEYQAIIPLPYFHIGSENFWKVAYGKEIQRSLWASVQTGLPVTGSFLGRTSLSQTINQLELVAEPYRRPAIFKGLPNDKPFLVFLYKKSYDLVWYRFNHLMYEIPVLYEDEHIKLYKLTIGQINQSIEKRKVNAKKNFENLKLFQFGDILSKDSFANFVYKNFDDLNASKSYRGNGFESPANLETVVYEGIIPNQQKDQPYVFSIWAFVKKDQYPKTQVVFEEFDEPAGAVLQKKVRHVSQDIRSFDNDWALMDTQFIPKSDESTIRFSLVNHDLGENKIYVDELQIRPQHARLFRKFENELMFNNRFYPDENDDTSKAPNF